MFRKLYLVIFSFFTVFSSSFLELKKEKLKEDTDPIYDKEIEFEISTFVNISQNRAYDRFEKILPQLILEELRQINLLKKEKINRSILKNEKEVLKALEEKKTETKKEYTMLEGSLKNQSQKILSSYSDSNSNLNLKQTYKKDFIKDIQEKREKFLKEKNKDKNLEEYLEINSSKNFSEKILGFNSKSRDFYYFKLNFSKNILEIKFRNNFNIEELIKKIPKKNKLLLLGNLEEKKEKIIINIKILDCYTKQFIYEKEFFLTSKDLSLDLDKTIELIKTSLKEDFFDENIKQGTLIVKTIPEKANIFLNDKKIGKSNITIKHPVGTYEITFLKKGFKKEKKRIFILDNEDTEVSVSLNELGKAKNTVKLETDPQEADVYFNLDYLGKTPLVFSDLTEGYHKLRIEKDEYQTLYQDLFIGNNDIQKYVFSLKKGKTIFQDYKLKSMSFNILRNSFFYFSFVSFGSMLFSIMEERRYYDQFLELNNNAFYFKPGEKNYILNQYNNSKNLSTAMILNSVFSLLGTLIFYFIELNIDDSEAGYKNYIKKQDNFTERQKFYFSGRESY